MENRIVVEAVEAAFRSINVCTLALFCLTERTRRGTQQIIDIVWRCSLAYVARLGKFIVER